VKASAQSKELDRDKLPNTIYFHDDFDDNRNVWRLFDHDKAKSYISDGKYHFRNKQEDKSYNTYDEYNIDPTANYYIEMDFAVTDGPGNYGSGLVFNRANTKKANKWAFIISPNGKYKIYKTIDTVDTDIQSWTATGEVKKEGNNRLGIFKKGGSTYFYINDKQVYDMKSPEYLGCGIGFTVARGSEIAVDDFSIYYHPDPVNEIEDAKQGYKKEPLGKNINGESNQSFPILSADGKMMCFSRIINPGSLGLDKRTVMHSEYNDATKEWSVATPFPSNINNRRMLEILYVSPDKKSIIINGTYDAQGKSIKGRTGISMSHKTATGWSDPETMPFDGLENKSNYSSYCMASNNRVLIISVNGEGSYGERDLYISFKQNEQWTKPRNMGPVLNSFGNDIQPCLAPDNVTLYYSSTGKPGYGKYDVFMSRRLDDTWLNWSEPQNLGPDINSAIDDMGLKVDADGIYAYMDYRDEQNAKSQICKIVLPPAARPKPVVILTGHVYNAITKAPMASPVIYENMATGNEEGNTVSSADDGSFVIVLPYGMEYGFTAKSQGYIGESKSVNLKSDTIAVGYKEMSVDLYLTPLVAGQSVKLNNIFFDVSKYDLLEASYPELDRLAEVLNQNSGLQLLVEGHTDQGGMNADIKVLQTLSENRANAVSEYLIKKGIDQKRIATVGYGNTRPISKDQNLNRRVEVKIVSM
jgi:outer membrane protein OmpA-like peptidoglycan-associated protein